MLTEQDIMEMLKEYANSPQGKADIKAEGLNLSGYTEEEARQIGEGLKKDIIEGFLALVRHTDKWFYSDGVKVGKPRDWKNGTLSLNVIFSNKALHRNSLHTPDYRKGYGFPFFGTNYAGASSGFTGTGVYDILGLFTQGYSTSKQVFGYWDNYSAFATDGDFSELGNTIASKTQRSGNSFISDIVARYEAQYPNLKIKYPKLWGGTL